MNTPLRTPIKRKCPGTPVISRREEDDFLRITPRKLFHNEEKKCPDAPRKKRVSKKRLIITNNGQIVGSFPLIQSVNDDINSCRRSLFLEKPSKIPRLIKKVKTPSKFADSLERKINASRRR
jgi:hypothetical protein